MATDGNTRTGRIAESPANTGDRRQTAVDCSSLRGPPEREVAGSIPAGRVAVRRLDSLREHAAAYVARTLPRTVQRREHELVGNARASVPERFQLVAEHRQWIDLPAACDESDESRRSSLLPAKRARTQQITGKGARPATACVSRFQLVQCARAARLTRKRALRAILAGVLDAKAR